jgi:protein OS-9
MNPESENSALHTAGIFRGQTSLSSDQMLFVFPFFCSSIPNYRTSFHDFPPPRFSPHPDTPSFEKQVGSSKFRCYVEENQTPRTDSNPEKYLRSVLLRTCYEMTATNYWYYKFCPFRDLSQFRYADDRITRIDVFKLAQEHETTQYAVVDRALVANWTGGDMCVVTRKSRTARVELVCDMSTDDDGRLVSVSEPTFCHYLVRFHTQHACVFPNITTEELAVVTCIKQDNDASARTNDEL